MMLRRERMYRDPVVQAELERAWQAVSAASARAVPSDEHDGAATIGWQQYAQLCAALLAERRAPRRAPRPTCAPPAPPHPPPPASAASSSRKLYLCLMKRSDPHEAFLLAKLDWERDTRGWPDAATPLMERVIDRATFFRSWFELADVNTDDMEEETYGRFIERTIRLIVRTDARSGACMLRSDAEVMNLVVKNGGLHIESRARMSRAPAYAPPKENARFHQQTIASKAAQRDRFTRAPVLAASTGLSPRSATQGLSAASPMRASKSQPAMLTRAQLTERVDDLMFKLRPLSAPNRVALFHTAVAFVNGTHRIIGDGMCAAALQIANASMSVISRSAAYDDLLERLARTFSLSFTGPNVEAGGRAQIVLPSEQRYAGKEMAGARMLREQQPVRGVAKFVRAILRLPSRGGDCALRRACPRAGQRAQLIARSVTGHAASHIVRSHARRVRTRVNGSAILKSSRPISERRCTRRLADGRLGVARNGIDDVRVVIARTGLRARHSQLVGKQTAAHPPRDRAAERRLEPHGGFLSARRARPGRRVRAGAGRAYGCAALGVRRTVSLEARLRAKRLAALARIRGAVGAAVRGAVRAHGRRCQARGVVDRARALAAKAVGT